MAKARRPRTGKLPWPRQRPGFLAFWRDHARIFSESAYFVTERLGTSLLVWLLVGIALALPGGLFLLERNLAAMTGSWEGRPGLSVYFELAAEPAVVRALAETLEAQASVAGVTVISEEQALEEFRAYSGLADALTLLEDNPLPASLRAVLRPGAGPEELDALAALAGGGDGVAEVVVEKTWLERVNDVTHIVNRLGIMLAILFGLGAILVTATSVRLAIEARLEELRVLKLVGATEGQMRRPFLYFGLIYGLGGALVAAMLISLCLLIVEGPLAELLGSYGRELDLAGFDLTFLGALFAIAAALGVSGALLAARQRISELEIL